MSVPCFASILRKKLEMSVVIIGNLDIPLMFKCTKLANSSSPLIVQVFIN